MTCDKCKNKNALKLTFVKKNYFICQECVNPERIDNNFKTMNKVFIKDYGWVLKSRLDEIRRRRILPYERGDSGYYVGRMSENGRIQEREPNY